MSSIRKTLAATCSWLSLLFVEVVEAAEAAEAVQCGPAGAAAAEVAVAAADPGDGAGGARLHDLNGSTAKPGEPRRAGRALVRAGRRWAERCDEPVIGLTADKSTAAHSLCVL